ncbi:hypothetical protein ABIF14_002654 [Bradyrhizobium elkanii]
MGLHHVQLVSYAMIVGGFLGLVGLARLARYAPDCSDKQ